MWAVPQRSDTARGRSARAISGAQRRTAGGPVAGTSALLALQRRAGNAAVSALVAGKSRSEGATVERMDAALRELRSKDPAIDVVEAGLKGAKEVGVPVDLEGTPPPAAALTVTLTGFGPGAVDPLKPPTPPRAVPAVPALGQTAAGAKKAGPGGSGVGKDGVGPGKGDAGRGQRGATDGSPGALAPMGGGGAAGLAGPVTGLAPDQLRQPPKPPLGIRPGQDPAFTAVTGEISGASTRARAHASAAAKAKEAQDASVPPPGDLAAQAETAKVEEMDAQQPGEFDKKAFIAAVQVAIEARSPKTLEEADEYRESGAAGEVAGEVSGLVAEGTGEQSKDIATATEAPPDPSKAVPKPVVPMAAEPVGHLPPVPATGAVPKPAPPEQTNLQAGKHQAEAELAGAEVTEEQLERSNEPDFQQAVVDKQAAAEHADTAPAQFRQEEQQVLERDRAGASAGVSEAVAGMQGTRAGAIAGLVGDKGAAKEEDESTRGMVAGKIDAIYVAAEQDVKALLDGIDPKVEKAFGDGEASARAAFESYVGAKMSAYKRDRYGGMLGGLRWGKDKLLGMPSKVNEFYQAGRELYLKRMDGVISRVADIVGGDLGRAKKRIAAGKAQITAYVTSLPAELRKTGARAAQQIGDRFASLEGEVTAKQEATVQALASRYVESRQALDARVEELQAANQGLVDKALGAIKGVLGTIRELAAMLESVLARVSGVVGKIIKDPVGFLGNLIAGVKGGILKFRDNIVEHLRKGLMGWLFGALGEAGIELPETFDVKGVVKLLASLFGMTWATIRSRITRRIGARAMAAAERGVGIFQVLSSEGVGGLWEMLLDKFGDIKETILTQVKEFVVTKIIIAGVTWLIGLLNPAAAFIKACKLIYDIVMFFVRNAARLARFVNTVIDSIADIAGGKVSGVRDRIDDILGQMLPLIIGFLASAIGLGGIGQKIRKIVSALRRPFMRAVDFVVDRGLRLAAPLIRGLKNVGGHVKGRVAAGKAWARGKVDAAQGWAAAKAGAVKERFGRPKAAPADSRLSAALHDVRTAAAGTADGGLGPADLRQIKARYALRDLSQQAAPTGVTVTAQLLSESITLAPGSAGLGHARDGGGILPGRTGSYASLSGKQDPRKSQNPCLGVYAEHVLPRNFIDAYLQAMGFTGMARQGYDYDNATTVLMYQQAKTEKDKADTDWRQALADARAAGAALRDRGSTPTQRAAAHQDLMTAIDRRAHASSIEAVNAVKNENFGNARLRQTADPADSAALPTPAQISHASVEQTKAVRTIVHEQATRMEEGTGGNQLAVKINSDPRMRLQDLLGVGPRLAERIDEARHKKPFTSANDLKRVSGIGDSVVAWNADRIVV